MIRSVQHIVLLLVCILSYNCSFSQATQQATRPEVRSKKFSLLLSKMVKEEVPLISVDSLYEHTEDFVILDAREKEEFKISHIEGAQYIGYDAVDFSAVEDLPKDTPIVIYCSIGVRSEHIGVQLQEQGFTNVQNLYGSIFEWANKGYMLVDNAGYPTKKVHAYNWAWGKWMINDSFEKVY